VRDRPVHVQHRSVMSDTAIGFLVVAFLVLAVLWVIEPVLFSGPSHKAPPSLADGGSTTATVPWTHTPQPTAKAPPTRADTTLQTATATATAPAKTKVGLSSLPQYGPAQSDNSAQPVIGSAESTPTNPEVNADPTITGATANPSGAGGTATGTAAPANPISAGGATNPSPSGGTTGPVPATTKTMTLLTCSSTGRH
jgi:hypothetical protein